MALRPHRLLASAQFAGSVGDGAFYVTSALYFTRVVGLPTERVGLGLTLAWGVGSLVGVPLGRLADRRGPRGTAVGLACATAVAVGTFLLVRGFPLFVFAACAYATAQSGLSAARQALLAGLVPAGERTGVLARVQSTLNAGLAVGAALGGLALAAGTAGAYRSVLALDAACFAGCALLLLRLPTVTGGGTAADGTGPGGAGPGAAGPGGRRLAVLGDRPYALVALVNAVLLLRLPLLSLALPLWITQRTGAPPALASGLFVLNTVGVTLFQVRAASSVTGTDSALRVLRRAGLLMLASCAVFALSAGRSAWPAALLLCAGAVLQVVAETWQSAGSWQLSFGLAPADRIGEYQGFFGTGVAVARTLGPLLVTWLLLGRGTLGWLLLGAVLAGASYAMGPVARRAVRHRPVTAAGAPEPGEAAL
ncbi:MFS transporter [Streptomyces sp. J2-1]|uniref:MFS transporter n=1 Tax=Streptomyces corallincola TaxID=2851888 RepID=UPI001C39510D|nr:MFS transporter [Streptomyces corallincola]MBV2354769.1 MFS transporter [Streptomyces corallincola]